MTNIQNSILTIKGDFDSWLMMIDLKVITEQTGVYVYERDVYGRTTKQLQMKKSETRRLLKYILPYLDTDDILQMIEIFGASELVTSIFIDVIKEGKRFYELDNGSNRN